MSYAEAMINQTISRGTQFISRFYDAQFNVLDHERITVKDIEQFQNELRKRSPQSLLDVALYTLIEDILENALNEKQKVTLLSKK